MEIQQMDVIMGPIYAQLPSNSPAALWVAQQLLAGTASAGQCAVLQDPTLSVLTCCTVYIAKLVQMGSREWI